MFKPKAERQIAQAADKIVSQKEGLDALSWNRVMEIAHILQGGCDQEISVDLGSELSGIAHSNISLSYKLGIEGSVHTGQNMPSGIEMLEGTTPNAGAQAVEGVQSPAAAAPLVAAPAAVAAAPEAAPSADDVPEKQADTHNLIFGDYVFPVPNVPPADPLPEAAAPAVSEVEAAAKVATAVVSEGEAAAKAAEEARRAASAEKDREFARYFALPMDDPQEKPQKKVVTIPVVASTQPELTNAPVAVPVATPVAAPVATPVASVNSAATTNPFPKIVAAAPAARPTPAPVQQAAPMPLASASAPTPAQPAPDPAPAADPEVPAQPAGFARFRNVYSSRDDRLCMFEDAEGHLIAVDSSKLA
ncbi:MAG: hypothetical protein RR572_01600 [Raoultibacter sp.]